MELVHQVDETCDVGFQVGEVAGPQLADGDPIEGPPDRSMAFLYQ